MWVNTRSSLGNLQKSGSTSGAHLLSGLAAAYCPYSSEVQTGSRWVHQVWAHPRTQNWTFGAVQPQCWILDQTWVQFTQGSGPDQSSELNCGIPIPDPRDSWNPWPNPAKTHQGRCRMEKKGMGSKIFELTCELGLSKYVSRCLSIYHNGISMYRWWDIFKKGFGHPYD